jgi:hypothetical protein
MIYRGPSFLACGRMIRLHAHPLPPSTLSKVDRRLTGRLRKRDKLLTGEGRRGWAWSRIVRQQESLALYKSFNTL